MQHNLIMIINLYICMSVYVIMRQCPYYETESCVKYVLQYPLTWSRKDQVLSNMLLTKYELKLKWTFVTLIGAELFCTAS